MSTSRDTRKGNTPEPPLSSTSREKNASEPPLSSTSRDKNAPEPPLTFAVLEPSHPDAQALIGELNAALYQITGCDGSASFHGEEMLLPGAAFLVAYRGDRPVACGGFYPLAADGAKADMAEVKRVYAREPGCGAPLLRALETLAGQKGYACLVCETRRVNARAVAFYLRNGWRETEPYGKYVGRPEAICFEKRLKP